jgi:hypothetical protein
MEKNEDLETPLVAETCDEETCSLSVHEDAIVQCLQAEDEGDTITFAAFLVIVCLILASYTSYFMEIDNQLMEELSFKEYYMYTQVRNKIGFSFEGDEILITTFYDSPYSCEYLSQFISGTIRCLNVRFNAYDELRW